ncbi:unnamed protein product [Symbiodinium sp. CCMP2456]|nr:unnamed protein product [Symbiodinium sp. CCMP2456]
MQTVSLLCACGCPCTAQVQIGPPEGLIRFALPGGDAVEVCKVALAQRASFFAPLADECGEAVYSQNEPPSVSGLLPHRVVPFVFLTDSFISCILSFGPVCSSRKQCSRRCRCTFSLTVRVGSLCMPAKHTPSS